MVSILRMQGRAGLGRAGQGKAGESRAGQGRVKQVHGLSLRLDAKLPDNKAKPQLRKGES